MVKYLNTDPAVEIQRVVGYLTNGLLRCLLKK